MNIIDRIFAKKPRIELPAGGRSSVNASTINSAIGILGQYFGKNQLSHILPVLENASIYNPDVSHAIRNWINIANTGHKLILEGGTPSQQLMALEDLNRLAPDLYKRSYGIDGLINHYLLQIIVTGAISSEDIIAQTPSNGLEAVEIVPTSQIRFKYENDWTPYQYANGQEYKLNPFTYHYLSHLPMYSDRPEAKPLIISVIDPLRRQRNMHDNIDYIMRKFGMLGFVALSINPPPKKIGEADSEYEKRLINYQERIAKSLADSYKDGTMVHFSDHKLDFHNIGAMSQGSYEVHKLNEEQVFSGIGIDPAMQGRSYSTTETYAGVVYNLTAQEAATLQRMAKRRIESTYNLHLMLTGSPCTVKLKFSRIAEKDPKVSAEREQIDLDNAIKKVKSGLLTPQQAAQELGYDVWENEALIAEFNAKAGEYGSPF